MGARRDIVISYIEGTTYGMTEASVESTRSPVRRSPTGKEEVCTLVKKAQARLVDVAPELYEFLLNGTLPPPEFPASAITCETVQVTMRDGVRLATDVYLPPVHRAPVLVSRGPIPRDVEAFGVTAALTAFARRGYAVVSQDCRGTGESEPADWDYLVHEREDGPDLIDWICEQEWYGGFIASCGGSYTGLTQWCMSANPAMSAIAPAVSGLGIAVNTVHLYMFVNSYARVVGNGADKVPVSLFDMERVFEQETLAGGYFNEPLQLPLPEWLVQEYPVVTGMHPAEARQWLWERYCGLSSARRAEFVRRARGVDHVTMTDMEAMSDIFGHRISHARHIMPHADPAEMCRLVTAPPLMLTAWYDWGVNDALATFRMLRREGRPEVADGARIIITPRAHNRPGYRLGTDEHPELVRASNMLDQVGFLDHWFTSVRNGTTESWPRVTYYLMGANEWRTASDWPVPEATERAFYLGGEGVLSTSPPAADAEPDVYAYDPEDPTPTVAGSFVSFHYTPGSGDVSEVQRRGDVLVYTTPPLDEDLDVVGPLLMVLYAGSSAVDTDFNVRLSDVWPDGRAFHVQSGMLRARYRTDDGAPELLEPGKIYRLEVDMWATAMRFRAGHRLRVDISSADFPRFDRNTNLGGEPGAPVVATQTIYRDRDHPSHLVVPVVDTSATEE
ncbi:CocE/NonD family hydrolase [Nonomuraea sp. KC401]|nr:CocE/NonD family hydrolase [Nonomuraea sp. KC401]